MRSERILNSRNDHSCGSGSPEASISSFVGVGVISSSDGTVGAGLGNRGGSPEASISSFDGVGGVSSSDGTFGAGIGLDSDSRSGCDEAGDGELHVVFVLFN